MLNGIDPILIFNFKKLITPPDVSGVPIVAEIVDAIGLTPIPIYLSQGLTGLIVESEDKNVDIDTDISTLSTGGVKSAQRGLNSSITVNLIAQSDSIGLPLLTAMIDQIFSRVSSKEYSLSYLHGATIIFGALLKAYSVTQGGQDDLYRITLEIAHSGQSSATPSVGLTTNAVGIDSGVSIANP